VQEPAFFSATAGGLEPHPDARAPWSADMLHGRLLAGLAAWSIERDHGDDGFAPVRLTVDLYRAPAMQRTTVETTAVRSGGRVRVADALLHVGGVEVARASTLWLRRGEVPDGDEEVPVTPPWDAPPPVASTPEGIRADPGFELAPAGGLGFGEVGSGPRRAWLRDRRELVAGVALTPFVRAALLADFASPFANAGPHGLDYINADMTLHLGRLPLGEWIGIESDDRVADEGVSVVQCRYYDEEGAIGWSSACAVLNPRMPRAAEG
jgi:hypothetical protein